MLLSMWSFQKAGVGQSDLYRLMFCAFPLPFYCSVRLYSLLASEFLHHISTMSSLAAALLPQTGSLLDESLTLKMCQGRKCYLPASSDEFWGLKQGLGKGRRHQWADCCSNVFVLLFLALRVSDTACNVLWLSSNAPGNHQKGSHWLWSGLQPTKMPLSGFTAIGALGIVLLLLSHTFRYLHPLSPHKQCFTGVWYNPWWQKEVTFSWMWADFEAVFLGIYCDCSGKCFTSVLLVNVK